MRQCNVVVTIHERGLRRAFDVLSEFGTLKKTEFFNVLAMSADDVGRLLEALRERTEENPDYLSFLSKLIPVDRTFTFQTPEEFEHKAREAVLPWVPELGGRSFHVRMHRRGFKGKLSSYEEEHFIDGLLLEELEKAGNPGHITFEDPEAVVVVETISQWAGFSLFRREHLRRYPFLRVD